MHTQPYTQARTHKHTYKMQWPHGASDSSRGTTGFGCRSLFDLFSQVLELGFGSFPTRRLLSYRQTAFLLLVYSIHDLMGHERPAKPHEAFLPRSSRG